MIGAKRHLALDSYGQGFFGLLPVGRLVGFFRGGGGGGLFLPMVGM